MKNKDLTFIVDQLSNSMEHYTVNEFVEFMVEETFISESQAIKLWTAYWNMEPLKRFQLGFTENGYVDFINETINK